MVDLFVQSRYKVNRQNLKRRVVAFLSRVGISLEDFDLSLAIVGDQKMKKLNQKYREKKETTPVLAFPMTEASSEGSFGGSTASSTTLLGEIVVSFPQARLLAGEENKLVDEKIGELVEHGLTKLLTTTA